MSSGVENLNVGMLVGIVGSTGLVKAGDQI